MRIEIRKLHIALDRGAVNRAVDRVRRGGVRQVRRQRFACTGAQLAPDDLLM